MNIQDGKYLQNIHKIKSKDIQRLYAKQTESPKDSNL